LFEIKRLSTLIIRTCD